MAYKPIFDKNDNFFRTLRSRGMYSREDIYNSIERFTRIKPLDPYGRVGTSKEYFFMTRPDLHIFHNYDPSVLNPEIANMPYFVDLMQRGYGIILKQLQYSVDVSQPFVNIITKNKISNVDIPDLQATSIETSANIYGTRLFYRENSDQHDEAHSFSIDFEDNKYLEMYTWLKAFDEYESKKYYGNITPPDDSYTIFKKIHDQMSGFKIIVGEDDETIIYYAKLYGCYPENVPRSTFSELPADGNIRYTSQWKASMIEDSNPNILVEFNSLTKRMGGSAISHTYDFDIQSVDGDLLRAPYIQLCKPGLGHFATYKLKWRK